MLHPVLVGVLDVLKDLLVLLPLLRLVHPVTFLAQHPSQLLQLVRFLVFLSNEDHVLEGVNSLSLDFFDESIGLSE